MNTIDHTHAKARLLVVDDEPAHMTALQHTLEDAGYAVRGFASAAAALEALSGDSFDLILTDLQMPGMDGIGLLRAAQELDPHLVGVVMTGYGSIDTAIDAMKAGALDYVLKPFKLSVILPILGRALEVRRLRLEITQLQQQVQEHMTELELANRELETFSYSVSHDLRAPLRAISGFSNLLVENYAPQLPDDAQQLVNRIMASADRMSKLIDHLLRFSQLGKQPISKRSVDLHLLISDVLDELLKAAPHYAADVRLQNLPPAVGDPVLIRQVFANLLSNALKFTRECARPIVEVGSKRERNETVYFVRDNGVGFDMQYAEQLFQVFRRLHAVEQFEGTGVGLSLVQRIIQRHGGRIWAEGTVGGGATFYFTLPN